MAQLTLLAEAATLILCAALAVRRLPLQRLAGLASRPLRAPVPAPETGRRLAGEVRWAVGAAAARSPLRALCFERGLAAQIMLRRRGVDSTLFYGARLASEKLDAHVWVLFDGEDVTGMADAAGFAMLASFPPGRGSLGGGAQEP